ncbi:translation initiation factor eIF-5 [Rhodotorula toruloides]|uniref:Translation initiation factor eIF-5 n=1 Tax=Rhodotorula toruloides TaxID=5286 RepID=A0A511KNA7_RHOTO|nr:translation initiation factor eIF-5 [Rhodotorula toruloides]
MATVNIRRDVKDSFYRYKMPVLLTKIEGRGNGIKTVLPNMADVARALNRPASYPTKYFGSELGAQSTCNDDTERYIVNGAHDQNRMRELLDGFIDKFVLCQSCKNPETELIVSKDEYITADCKACGHVGDIDMRHKLSGYIVKNPPKKASKKGKKGAAGADSIAGQPGQVDEDEDDDQDELTRKIREGAAEVMSEEQAAKLIAQREADEDWGEDTSPEAVAARMAALGVSGDSSLLGGDDDEEEAGGPYAEFATWVKENKDEVSAAEIYKEAETRGVAKKTHRLLPYLFPALFTDKVADELPKYLALLAKITNSDKAVKALGGGIEKLLGVDYPDAVAQTPKVLMELYQNDIMDEDAIKHFATHVSKKYVSKDVSKRVRKAAEPMVKWLEEAESDEEESDDEEGRE